MKRVLSTPFLGVILHAAHSLFPSNEGEEVLLTSSWALHADTAKVPMELHVDCNSGSKQPHLGLRERICPGRDELNQ